MKLAIGGDLHITNQTPSSRKDNYPETQEKKIEFIFKSMRDNRADYLLQPGDLMDRWESPDRLKTRTMRLLRRAEEYIREPAFISVPGQHDIRYHTSPIENTPYGVVNEALGNFWVANDKPIEYPDLYVEGIDIYGAPWNKPIPEILDKNKFNILITHRMVSETQEWPGQKYDVPGTLLRESGFNLIVSGDNHRTIEFIHKGKILLNAGSLMRSKINQVDHRPCIFIFDTETLKYKKIFIPVESSDRVFDFENSKAEAEKDDRLARLITTLKNRSKISGIDFRLNMSNIVSNLTANNGISKSAYEIYEEVFDE